MTDLEDLWSDYPTPPPPVDALVWQARRQARVRRRRLVVRPLLAGFAAACVATGLVVGTHVHLESTGSADSSGSSAGSGSSASLAGPALRNSAFRADLHPAASCGQLLASYRSRGSAQVGPWGWGVTDVLTDGAAIAGAAVPQATASEKSADAAEAGVGSSATGTNVQEAGVDEPDEVKTDGTLLARAHGSTVTVYDVTGASVRPTARITLPHLANAQLLLHGTTLLALGTDTAAPAADAPSTRVETISLTDPAHPAVTAQVRYPGSVASARQHGSVVRLVLTGDLPQLPFVHPHGSLTAKQALARNRAIVRRSGLDDWLPRYDDGSGSRPLLDCAGVALPPAGVPLGTESIVGFHLAAPARPTAIGIAGLTDIAYESATHLYLTSSPRSLAHPGCLGCVHPLSDGASTGRTSTGRTSTDRTSIFQLDLHGTRATHVATGRLTGTIANRWSMDEARGVLRVALTHGDGKRRASAVVTLRPVGTRLVQVGRLDGLGVDETLTAARWFGDLGILSTARRTDPLFTVDLADPAHPVLLGALHIPGYTTYFHPIGHDQLLGIGQKVSFEHGEGREHERAQVGLFDIGDLRDVRQLAVTPLEQWTWPTAGDDPRAFTWLADRSTALTSFSTRGHRVLLGEYHVTGTTMSQRLVPLRVRPGRTVRTVELPSGRVVLVAGGHVSFLALRATPGTAP